MYGMSNRVNLARDKFALQRAALLTCNKNWQARISKIAGYNEWYLVQVRRNSEGVVKEWIDIKLAEQNMPLIKEYMIPFMCNDVEHDDETVQHMITVQVLFVKMTAASHRTVLETSSIKERKTIGITYGIIPIKESEIYKMMSSSGVSATQYKPGDKVVIKNSEDKVVYDVVDVSNNGTQVCIASYFFNKKESYVKSVDEIAYASSED